MKYKVNENFKNSLESIIAESRLNSVIAQVEDLADDIITNNYAPLCILSSESATGKSFTLYITKDNLELARTKTPSYEKWIRLSEINPNSTEHFINNAGYVLYHGMYVIKTTNKELDAYHVLRNRKGGTGFSYELSFGDLYTDELIVKGRKIKFNDPEADLYFVKAIQS